MTKQRLGLRLAPTELLAEVRQSRDDWKGAGTDMRTYKPFLAVALAVTFFSTTVRADCELGDAIGYTIVGRKTIAGYVTNEGMNKEEFEGCEHDRLILFSDGTALRCATYSYTYSYMPTAILLSTSFNYQGRTIATWKMCVNGHLFDMRTP